MSNFWKNLNKPFTVLAPMDGVTDNVFRQVIIKAARPDVFFTEFTNADGLVHGANGIPLKKLAYTKEQHPIVAQIWGTDPGNFKKAAKIVSKLGFDGIDINMGCAVRDIIKRGAGAGLIGNYELAGEIIDATKDGANGLPVSVKTRLGNQTNIAEEWIHFLLNKKLDCLTVHARTAKEMSKVPANWDEVKKIVDIKNKISPSTIIIGNGDVRSYKDAIEKAEKYGVDGVMIARGIFANPWVFDTKLKKHTKSEHLKLLVYHLNLFEKTYKDVNYAVINKYFKIYVKGFEGANELRVKLMESGGINEARRILSNL